MESIDYELKRIWGDNWGLLEIPTFIRRQHEQRLKNIQENVTEELEKLGAIQDENGEWII